jgi:glycosyltransferase involved in cell wall biosynthesis
MRIVIDARMYGLEHAGIGRYVMSLINQLEIIDKKNDYLLLLRRKDDQGLRFKNRRFQKVIADYPHYSFREQILLPLQLSKLKPDLVHFPHFNVPIFWRGRFVVTIHDLIKHESKGAKTTTRWRPFYWLKHLVYRLVIWLAIKRAVKIVVPSRWWKKEIVRRYRLSPKKVAAIYEGVDESFLEPNISHREAKKVLERYNLQKPFIIYTGSLYPHKNIESLVKAVKRLHLVLVVVCARSVFYQRFMKKVISLEAEKFVNFAGFVPDNELAVLYQKAEAFVLPSLLEGFGLIGLEAMAAGCPVVCSDIPVLREIYGDAALYFNPYDVKDMAEKIKKVINDKQIGNKLINKGLKQVKKYSWQKMAMETLEVYKNLRHSSENLVSHSYSK